MHCFAVIMSSISQTKPNHCPVPPRPRHWNCVFVTVSVAWNERAGTPEAGDVASVLSSCDLSPHWSWQFLGSFVGYRRFAVPGHKKSTQQLIKYIARPWAEFKFNTQVLKLTPVIFRRVVSRPVPPRPRHWNCVFGTVLMAWNERVGQLAAGIVTSVWSIPAPGTVFSRLLCGL